MEKTIKKVIFLLILCPGLAFADVCEPGIIHIEKGTPSPCTGYLIDDTVEEYFNDLYEDNEQLKRNLVITNDILKETHHQLMTCQNQLNMCESTMRAIDRGNKVKRIRNTAITVVVGAALGILVYEAAK